MSACRAQRPRRSGSKWSNATRRSACGCRRDAGWPGKRGAHRALAVRLRSSHHTPRPWPFAGGGSGRVSRPPGRRPSSCDQCGSTAATAPRAWSAAGCSTKLHSEATADLSWPCHDIRAPCPRVMTWLTKAGCAPDQRGSSTQPNKTVPDPVHGSSLDQATRLRGAPHRHPPSWLSPAHSPGCSRPLPRPQ